MVGWVWLLVAFFLGNMSGLLAIAIVTANDPYGGKDCDNRK